MNNPTVVSLFAGIGGIDLAFIQVGFRIIFANDKDKYTCITYNQNFENNNLVEADISGINEKAVPTCDVITAGFPCQSFSVMGHQRGFKDVRGNLFFEIIRIAKSTMPKVIFLENVKNLIYHDKGKTFITISNSLAELGYYIRYDVENAAEYGNVPQNRSRTYIVAFRDLETMNKFDFPYKIKCSVTLNDIFNRSIKHHDDYYYKKDSKYFNLLDQRIPDKTGIYRIDDTGVAMRKYILAPTLKANMGTYHDRVPIIRDDYGIRKITPYECLALQGFPTWFKFKNIPIEEAYKQCGNTVCVPVVRRIADNIYKVLVGDSNEK